MKTIARATVFLIGVGSFAMAINLLSSSPAAATNPQPVIVANTPLPVQGSISVANTPSVNIANTSIPVTGSVAVTNALDAGNRPVPLVVSPQGQPYQDGCLPNVSTGECLFATIPAGMRLVIHEFDVAGYVPTGELLFFLELFTQLDNAAGVHDFPFTYTGTDGSGHTFLAMHQPTTLFADPGSAPTCVVRTDFQGRCGLSGYLMPVQ